MAPAAMVATAAVPSYAQERRVRVHYATAAATTGPDAKNIPVVCRLPGPVDLGALDAALRAFVARHRALQYRFTRRGQIGLQHVPDGAGELRCKVTDLAGLPAQPGAEESFIRSEIDRPFDLLGWPLLRAGVVRSDRPAFYLAMDHAVADGWSVFLAKAELEAMYAAELSGRPVLSRPAGDFFRHSAAERRRYAPGPWLDAQLSDWWELLGGRPVHPSFPVGGPGWDLATGRYRRVDLLDRDGAAQFVRTCRLAKTSVFMGVLAAYGVAIREVTGHDETGVLVGLHNRDDPAVHDSVGWHANMLPLYFPTAGIDEFGDALRNVRGRLMPLLDHHELPLPRILDCSPDAYYDGAGERFPTCFISFMDVRGPSRGDSAGGGQGDPPWARIETAPSYRVGYGIWVFLTDEGMAAVVASPQPRTGAADLEQFESTFADVLGRVVVR